MPAGRQNLRLAALALPCTVNYMSGSGACTAARFCSLVSNLVHCCKVSSLPWPVRVMLQLTSQRSAISCTAKYIRVSQACTAARSCSQLHIQQFVAQRCECCSPCTAHPALHTLTFACVLEASLPLTLQHASTPVLPNSTNGVMHASTIMLPSSTTSYVQQVEPMQPCMRYRRPVRPGRSSLSRDAECRCQARRYYVWDPHHCL